MSLRWYATIVDSHDIKAQAHWWAETLNWQVLFYEGDGEVTIVPQWVTAESYKETPWDPVIPEIGFVQVEDTKTLKNRVHLDLAPELGDDRDAMIQRLLERGAKLVEVGQSKDATFTVLQDPEGNEFCVLSCREK